jgi:hypothetical protein
MTRPPTGGVIHLSGSRYVLYRYMQSFLPPARAQYPIFGRVAPDSSKALNELLSA